jgi:hypothetical protein
MPTMPPECPECPECLRCRAYRGFEFSRTPADRDIETSRHRPSPVVQLAHSIGDRARRMCDRSAAESGQPAARAGVERTLIADYDPVAREFSVDALASGIGHVGGHAACDASRCDASRWPAACCCVPEAHSISWSVLKGTFCGSEALCVLEQVDLPRWGMSWPSAMKRKC